jgi:hypothetical protein
MGEVCDMQRSNMGEVCDMQRSNIGELCDMQRSNKGEVCDMQRSNKNGVSISAKIIKGRLNWRVNLRTSYGSTILMVAL